MTAITLQYGAPSFAGCALVVSIILINLRYR